jgi:hypothetical protein
VIAALKNDVLAQIEAPMPRESPDAARRLRAEMLLTALACNRERLFELRSLFILRLHKASDDFGATEALRVVEAAIAMIDASRPLAPNSSVHATSDWARVKGCGEASMSVP